MCDSTDSTAGPSGESGAKRPKLGKKTFKQTVPLTQDALERYLLDSDDDIGDPDIEESVAGWARSSDSDEEQDLSVLEETTPDILDNNLDLATPQSPTPQLKRKAHAPADVVIWDAVKDNMTQIPFTKQRELLVQPNGNEPKHYFDLLFDDDFLEMIVRETQSYAEDIFLSENTKEKSRITQWATLTKEELKIFLGLVLHMGSIRMNRLQDYWKTHRLFNIPAFSNYMSRDRFMIILRCLHFSQNPKPQEPKPEDRLFKIRPVVDYFNSKMKQVYYPGKNISLDDSMVLCRGRLVSRQYIKNKRHKYGVKLYLLTEPDGTVLKFSIYTGTLDDFGDKGHSANVVLNLMEEKLDAGHSLYLDNVYNSYDLACKLLSRKTYCTGTLRADRKQNPVEVMTTKLKKGETIARYLNGVMIGKWRANRDVFYTSTEFVNNLKKYFNRRQQEKEKPEAICEYNKSMRGMDKKDQMMSYYPCDMNTLRWYKKIAVYIFYKLLVNSFFLFKKYRQPRISLYEYRLRILEYLLPEKQGPSSAKKPRTMTHVPAKNPGTGGCKKHAHRKCTNCAKKKVRRETVFHCPSCPGKPALCFEPCFAEFHINV